MFSLEIEGNLKRNELRILHYWTAFTYGRAEQLDLLSYGRAEHTLLLLNECIGFYL